MWKKEEYEKTMNEIKILLKMTSSSVFNCFFSVSEPLIAVNYNKGFDFKIFVWNILYNIGFMYTNVKNLRKFVRSTTDADY